VQWYGGFVSGARFSALLILAMGMIFVFWAIWPLLPGRLPLYLLSSLNPEASSPCCCSQSSW
jgi:hypothetical protein